MCGLLENIKKDNLVTAYRRIFLTHVAIFANMNVMQDFFTGGNMIDLNSVSYLERPINELIINPNTALLAEAKEDTLKIRERAIKSAVVNIDDQEYKTSRRFWKTFNTQFKVSEKVYNLFTPEEVIQRISRNVGPEDFRFTIQGDTLMGMGHVDKNYLRFDQTLEFLYENGFDGVHLGQGFLEGSTTDEKTFQIGPDEFKMRDVLRLPIDGLSSATKYASLLRLICLNGLTGISQAFAQPINVAHDSAFKSLKKAMDNSTGGGETHELLIGKVDLMQTSALSLYEARLLSKGFKMSGYEKEGAVFDQVSNIYRYGVETVARSKDTLKNLPCVDEDNKIISAYDALNFVTQITSRPEEHVSIHGIRGAERLRAFVTELLIKDLDLPEMIKDGRDFEGIFNTEDKSHAKEEEIA